MKQIKESMMELEPVHHIFSMREKEIPMENKVVILTLIHIGQIQNLKR